ncbi:Partitioning defective 3 [Schistosoma japonicum]|nr:Partitioning defective 3 [Schistosoma japonicum]
MPTTRRLKMHKARLAAAATVTDPDSSITGQSIGISGPLKALHPVDTVLPQSLSKSSYRVSNDFVENVYIARFSDSIHIVINTANTFDVVQTKVFTEDCKSVIL